MTADKIAIAKEKFGALVEEQLKRVEKMKGDGDFVDYSKLPVIKIGICGGDGIGPAITAQAQRILEFLLKDEVEKGKIEFKVIDGLTIENRIKAGKAIPDDVLAQLKECPVILKGPTTTPRAGDKVNIESANVAMRKELDLFANVRPVRIPEEGIDWTFYRENTEGSYTLGSKGFNVDEDLAFDFTVATTDGTERIIRAAFEYAKKNNKGKVTCVTKANIIKTTDGKFLNTFKEIAKEYPDIQTDDWYIVLPNLYGDIITDEAAQFQGGVGTAGSINMGKKYAMFEAIHGSAPRMVEEGRDKYADPCSIIRAASMLLAHIGYGDKAEKLDKALDICTQTEKRISITGRADGCTSAELADYIMETIQKL